jgi:hypothetical protein
MTGELASVENVLECHGSGPAGSGRAGRVEL